MNLLTHKRGSVAMMTGLLLPVLLMAAAMGIEVTSWSVTKLELQRVADLSAWAGVAKYAASQNSQAAAYAAADLAEINGISTTATRTWNATTLTATDNLITAQVVSGVQDPTAKAVKVTVQRTVAKTLSLIFPSSATSMTISATATAELGPLGPQPCITALTGGIGTNISVTGNANLVTNNCSVRSNANISQSGGASINAAGVYAAGTIASTGICCNLHPNSGQISDPYANYSPIQNALNLLAPGAGTAVSVQSNASQTLNPGTYSSFDVQGKLLLNPGLYIVNGNISTGAQSQLSGNGVTIVTSGTLSTTGGTSLTLTAPGTNPTGSAVSGVLLAGTATTNMAFVGHTTDTISGVVYFPQATLTFAGQASSEGCTEVIAGTVTLVGDSNLNATCSSFPGLRFGSLRSSVSLVR